MQQILNENAAGKDLYAIEFTPKGSKATTTVFVWAVNRLDASNYLILNRIWGKQHKIYSHSSNLLK